MVNLLGVALMIFLLVVSVSMNNVYAQQIQEGEWFAIVQTSDGFYRMSSSSQISDEFCGAENGRLSDCTAKCDFGAEVGLSDFFCRDDFTIVTDEEDPPDFPPPPTSECHDDIDCDGIPDDEDMCKYIHSPKDRDCDGLYDQFDQCPDIPGVVNPQSSRNGCPLLDPTVPATPVDTLTLGFSVATLAAVVIGIVVINNKK